jgi:sulfide dehydrogenase cytochrome subunit
MKVTYLLLLSTAGIGLGASSSAAELDAMTGMCKGCHGDAGVSRWADVPTIAGIDAFTHAEALYVYRDNARPCQDSEYRQGDTSRASTNMCDIASEMSDEEIEQIAAHYAALPFKPAAQEFDAALAATGEALHRKGCDRCHSAGGSDPQDEAGILAGQWFGYMEQSFADYLGGEREQPDKMQEKMAELSAADVVALLHYYASQQ